MRRGARHSNRSNFFFGNGHCGHRIFNTVQMVTGMPSSSSRWRKRTPSRQTTRAFAGPGQRGSGLRRRRCLFANVQKGGYDKSSRVRERGPWEISDPAGDATNPRLPNQPQTLTAFTFLFGIQRYSLVTSRRPELYSRLFPCPHLPTSFCQSSFARHDTQRRRLQTRRSRPRTRPQITRTDHSRPAINHPSDLVWPALLLVSWSPPPQSRPPNNHHRFRPYDSFSTL